MDSLRDYAFVEVEDNVFDWVYWPMCAINGCENRICHWKSDKYCYPHSTNGKSFDDVMDEIKDSQLVT